MSATFTFKAPDELTSREVYHQFFHALRRVIGRTAEMSLLHTSNDSLSRSFALHNGDESHLQRAQGEIDLRGCALVCPAEPPPAPVVAAVEEAPAVEEAAVEETAAAAEEPVEAPAPASRRGRRSK